MIQSFIGMGIIAYAIFIMIFGKFKNLFGLLFCTSVFTTTTVINVSTNSITVPHLVGFLFILKICLGILTNKLKLYKPNFSFFIFLSYCFISIFFPIIFGKEIQLVGNEGTSIFGFHLIYQFIYLILSFLIFYGTEILYKNKLISICLLNKVLDKTFFITIFLSIFQLIDRDLFNNLFVNKIHTTFIQTLENGSSRLTATFNEPGMFALLLVFFLIYFTFRALDNKCYYIYILITFILGVLSTASIFYVGCFIWILIIISLNRKRINKLFCIFCIFCIVFFIIEYKFDNIFTKQIILLFDKLNGNQTSGRVRRQQLIDCLIIFSKYPFTGIGFGSNRSADLFSTWLSNIGLIGIFLFFNFIIRIFKFNLNLAFKQDIQFSAIKISLISVFILMFIGVTEPYYNFIWIMVGVVSANRSKKTIYI